MGEALTVGDDLDLDTAGFFTFAVLRFAAGRRVRGDTLDFVRTRKLLETGFTPGAAFFFFVRGVARFI